MRKIILFLILFFGAILRLPQMTEITGFTISLATILMLYLFVNRLVPVQRFPHFREIAAFSLAISPWHISILNNKENLFALLSLLGVYILLKIFKNYALQSVTVFLLLFIFLTNFVKPMSGFLNTEVPIWLTDEQRREHGIFYNHPLTVFIHNKIINYTFSFLDHYFQHFQGDFLFISGDVRDGTSSHLGQMYFFDLILIILSLIFLVRKPQGWSLVFLWLLLAPIPSALELQPPNSYKAANMIVPLVLLNSLGISILMQKLGIMTGK